MSLTGTLALFAFRILFFNFALDANELASLMLSSLVSVFVFLPASFDGIATDTGLPVFMVDGDELPVFGLEGQRLVFMPFVIVLKKMCAHKGKTPKFITYIFHFITYLGCKD
jgi:hypothetical protein